MADAHDCAKRNSHNRTFEEINKVSSWSLLNMRRSVSCYISNMRRSVSSDIQTRKSNISNTRRSVSSIFKHWEVLYRTREGVFHLILKHRKVGKKNSGIQSTLSPGRVTYELEKHVFKTAKLWRAELSGREKVQDPFQGMSRGILSKILCPHLMRRSNL